MQFSLDSGATGIWRNFAVKMAFWWYARTGFSTKIPGVIFIGISLIFFILTLRTNLLVLPSIFFVVCIVCAAVFGLILYSRETTKKETEDFAEEISYNLAENLLEKIAFSVSGGLSGCAVGALIVFPFSFLYGPESLVFNAYYFFTALFGCFGLVFLITKFRGGGKKLKQKVKEWFSLRISWVTKPLTA